MTLDLRYRLACSLGNVIDGNIARGRITQQWAIRWRGDLEIAGVVIPARGTVVELAYEKDGLLTRFPAKLYVLKAAPHPFATPPTTTVTVGCKLSLGENRKSTDRIDGETAPSTDYSLLPAALRELVPATTGFQAALLKCCNELGITLDPSSDSLVGLKLTSELNEGLAGGVVSFMAQLLESQLCYAQLTPDDKLLVRRIQLSAPTTGRVFTSGMIDTLEPINGDFLPPGKVTVTYRAVTGSPDSWQRPVSSTPSGGYYNVGSFTPTNASDGDLWANLAENGLDAGWDPEIGEYTISSDDVPSGYTWDASANGGLGAWTLNWSDAGSPGSNYTWDPTASGGGAYVPTSTWGDTTLPTIYEYDAGAGTWGPTGDPFTPDSGGGAPPNPMPGDGLFDANGGPSPFDSSPFNNYNLDSGPSGYDDFGPDAPPDPNRDAKMRRDWELSDVEGPVTQFSIEYKADGGNGTAIYAFNPRSRSITTYATVETVKQTLGLANLASKSEEQDVVSLRYEETLTCEAQTCPNLLKTKLEAGVSAPNTPLLHFSITAYEYGMVDQKIVVLKEVRSDYIAFVSLAGSLGIESFKRGNSILSPVSDPVIVGQIITFHDYSSSEGLKQTTVVRYLAWGLTQEGQQRSAASAQVCKTTGALSSMIQGATALVLDGVEVRTDLGRNFGVGTRPSLEDRLRNRIKSGDSGDYNWQLLYNALSPDTSYTDSLLNNPFDSESKSIGFTAGYGADDPFGAEPFDSGYYESVYDLPFAPDDTLISEQKNLTTIATYFKSGGSQQAAVSYGLMRLALDYGIANGFAMATDPRLMPTLAFEPVFIDHGGISAAFRTDGDTWTFTSGEAGGLIEVATDLILVGAAAQIPGSTPAVWIPLAASASSLVTGPAPTVNASPAPANTIATPIDFDPADPDTAFGSLPSDETVDVPPLQRSSNGIVQPFNIIQPCIARRRHGVGCNAKSYALNLGSESGLAVRKRIVSCADLGVVTP